ncbi:PTS galactitol transporter subunit IIB [Escherichia coli]|uniref:PTS galactitol transporter subunit IIB n=1 Tax=Escherichia coli TaxID=562 RepID=UPI000988A695|nr:PTS galactitol transporter subunit IIB [Escherichia coli]
MKRKIIVACGGAVATSTMAAEEIKELCQNHNIPVELIQCRVNEIETYMDGVHLICTTAKVDRSFGDIPEGANKRGNSSRLTQSFHFFMFEPIFSPVNALNQPI